MSEEKTVRDKEVKVNVQQQNDLITVVIPVYNVEAYLDRCVESIVKQTYQTLQIVLVDDGSPDKCPEMCDRWAKGNSKIEVIHKQNSGLGLSRNEGLKKAKGAYVCFVDSDDYIHETTIEKLYRRIKEKDSDICYYGCVDVVDGVESAKEPPQKLYHEGKEVQTEFAARLIGNATGENDVLFSGMSACYAFYRVNFLRQNGVEFHSEREKYISEDLIFNLSACSCAERITILPESLYYYVIRLSDSLRSTYRADRFEKSKLMYLKLVEYSEQFGLGESGRHRAEKYLLQTSIACAKMELLTKKIKKEILQTLRTYIKDETLKNIVRQYPIEMLPWKQRLFSLCVRYQSVHGMYVLAYLQNRRLKSVI